MEQDSEYEDVMRLRHQRDAGAKSVDGAAAPNMGSRGSARSEACGVGMLLDSATDGFFRVSRLAVGGAAAEHGGILVGDIIRAVDGVPLQGMSLDQVPETTAPKPQTLNPTP
jgi:C-terminal processing protease CtpA/Prc